MGMTIEERIAQWVRVKHYASPRHYETLDVAIDTMRKYQKIEQILDDWKSDGGAFEMSESYWLNQIREVVEDGNDD